MEYLIKTQLISTELMTDCSLPDHRAASDCWVVVVIVAARYRL